MGRALAAAGFSPVPVIIGKSGSWNLMGEDFLDGPWPAELDDRHREALHSGGPLEVAMDLKRRGVDVCVLGLHGRRGEDGTIQGFLETAGFAYTGSGVAASAVAIDKVAFKRLLVSQGLPTPPFEVVRRHEVATPACLHAILRRIHDRLGARVVVKAPSLGSSEHVYMAAGLSESLEAAREVLDGECRVLIEACIEGDEFTVPVLGPRDDAHPLPVIAIKPKLAAWFDRDSKYRKGGAEEIVPAPIKRPLARTLQELALRVHQVIGARGVTRTDFIVDGQGRPRILEINTLPGMTDASLVPKAASAAGISMPGLMEQLVNDARNAASGGPAPRSLEHGLSATAS